MRLNKIKVRKISVLKLLMTAFAAQLIFALPACGVEQAQTAFETSGIITAKAKSFLEETSDPADRTRIEVTVSQLDPRLRLRKCSNALKTYFPSGSRRMGKVTVAVSCDSPVAWKVFVSAGIYEYAKVVVAQKTISRKSIITGADITLERVNISKLRGSPALQLNQVIGSSTKKQIRAGVVVFEHDICMVCKGADVQVVAKNEHFNINMEGIALADATIGELTQIRNKKSKRSFRAKVVGRNQLEVLLRP